MIGGYRLRQLIGRGGSSVVYRASDAGSRAASAVAVKLAIAERCADPAFRFQFRQQIRVSAMLDHPSVLPVIDAGEHRGRPYIVMPHVDGADLKQRLLAGWLSVGRILALLRQVADGLDALHASGVLHLDVKPANVLVGRVAEDSVVSIEARPARTERAVLADLGLCRFLTDKPLVPGPDFVGSPRYSSPEHLCERAVRPSADVYALTCLLFASLAGQPPYTGGLPAIVTGHLSGRVPSLAALTGLPIGLDRVVRRGMHPDPGSRYRSCAELIDRARLAILDGRPERQPLPSKEPKPTAMMFCAVDGGSADPHQPVSPPA
jgi:serine/threonine protein kinase